MKRSVSNPLPKKPRKKSEPKKPVMVGDIARTTTSTVLDLKKKLPAVQIDMGQIKDWWYRHQHKFFIIVSVLIGALILSSFSTGHASVATFYPSSCLGDWEHAEGAQGEPSLPEESSPEQFSLENSARMPGSVSSIYCGGFKGAIPENSTPTKYKLTLSWSVDDESVVHTSSQPFETSSDDGAIVIPADELLAEPDTTTTEDTPPDMEPIPVEQAEEPSVLQSLLDHLFVQRVLAQESDPTPDAPTEAEVQVSDTPSVEEEVSSIDVVDESADQEVLSSETTDQDITEIIPEETQSGGGDTDVGEETPPADAFMEASYTLDGTQWHSLGMISRSAWQRVSFDIPLEGWENLDNLQVALKTIPSFDSAPVVYLDAMMLSVEYSDMAELVAPPTVLLRDTNEFVEGKEDYNSTEDVTFTLTEPNLNIQDIKTLVDEGKAEVVKDTQGVLGDKVQDPEMVQQTQDTIDAIKEVIDDTQDVIPTVDVTPAPIEPETPSPVVSFFKNLFSPAVALADAPTIQATVLDRNGAETDIGAVVITDIIDGVEKRHIQIDKPEREFRPGLYRLVVTFTTPQAIIVSQQNFTWGVLVINTNKSVYQRGDTAYIQMGVLNDAGHTICDSDLDLTITTPNGQQIERSTDDGTLVRDAQCGPDNVIAVPDYYTRVALPDEAGTYTMRLVAHTTNGVKAITDSFSVAAQPVVVVDRTGPSRIYPVALYPMTLRITSPVDWQGVVTERVPASFDILPPEQSIPYDSIAEEGDTKIISWNIALRAGEQATLGYYFNAPDVSPEFYILGKVALVGDTTLFEETRNWQIASDAACNATSSGTWSATANFLNCTGAASAGAGTGLRPGVNDALTINSGVALTADTTVTITSLAFAASTAATSLTINNGVTFTTTGTTTISSPGAAGTNTITVGGGTSGVFSTAGLSIPGSSTAGRFSTLTLSAGGTFTTTSGITFSGTAAQSRFTNSAAATINLTGTMSTGGTVTINSGTTLNTSGTAALNRATTFGLLNVTSGTTTMGAVAIIYSGLVTVANGATLTTSSATGLKTFSSGITVDSGGIFDLKTGSNFASTSSWGGNITTDGTTFNSGTGAVTLTGTGTHTISGSGNVSLGGTVTVPTNMTLTNSNTGTVTLGAITIASPTASNGISLTTGSTTAVTGALTFTANATANTQTITMNGTANISAGSLVINRPTTNGGASNITCASGGSGTFSTSGVATINGASTATATVNVLLDTCNFSSGGLLTFGGGSSGGNITFSLTTGTLTASAGITFSGTAARDVFTLGAGTFNLTGTMAAGGTPSIATGNTLVATGTAAINNATTFGNVTVSSGTLSLGGVAVTVAGDTAVDGSLASTSATGLKTFNGDVTVNSGGSFDLSAFATTTRFNGDVTASTGATVFNSGTGSVTFGGSSQSIGGTVAMSFGGTATINSGATVTNNNTSTVTIGAVTLASATVSNGLSLATGSTTTIPGAITYTSNAGSGDQTITMNGTANISASSLAMSAMTSAGSSNITCAPGANGTMTIAGTFQIRSNATAGQTGSSTADIGECTLTANATSIIGGSQTPAILSFSTGTLTVGSMNFSSTAANAQFITTGAATVNLSGTMFTGGTVTMDATSTIFATGTTAITGSYTIGNLNIVSGTMSLASGAVTVGGDTTISGSLVPSATNGLKTFTGVVTINSGGSFDFSNVSFNPAMSFAGGIVMNGTLFDSGTGAVAFTQTQDLSGTTAMLFGGTVTITNAQTLTNINTSTIDFNGNITGGGASADFSAGLNSTTRFAGTVMATGTLSPSTSINTVEYDGGTQTIKSPTTNPYYNLTISAAGVKSLAASTTVTGTVGVTAGTLDTVSGSGYALNAGTISIGASGTLLGQNSTITILGNWSNAGTFTAGSSTVVFNGAATATIAGATTFNNLTISHSAAKEVNFETAGSPVFAVTGLFTATGSSGNLIKLYSDTPATQWHFLPTGTSSVDYVDTRDGACESGAIFLSPTNFTNSGNNGTCWVGASLTFDFAISDASVGFGTLSSAAARYATGDTLGSSSEVEAHTMSVTTTAASGYTLSVIGATLTSGAHSIAVIGGSNTASNPGTPQFGMRLVATGGSGVVSAPYDGSGFAYDATISTPDVIASAASGDGVETVYSSRYMCNISDVTPSGEYATDLTYIVTGNF